MALSTAWLRASVLLALLYGSSSSSLECERVEKGFQGECPVVSVRPAMNWDHWCFLENVTHEHAFYVKPSELFRRLDMFLGGYNVHVGKERLSDVNRWYLISVSLHWSPENTEYRLNVSIDGHFERSTQWQNESENTWIEIYVKGELSYAPTCQRNPLTQTSMSPRSFDYTTVVLVGMAGATILVVVIAAILRVKIARLRNADQGHRQGSMGTTASGHCQGGSEGHEEHIYDEVVHFHH